MTAENVLWSYEEDALGKNDPTSTSGDVGGYASNNTGDVPKNIDPNTGQAIKDKNQDKPEGEQGQDGESGASSDGESRNNLGNQPESSESGGFSFSGKGRSLTGAGKMKFGGKFKAFAAAGFIVAILVVFGSLFSIGNLIPAGISARLSEETDMQYADAVESKLIVFQAAMRGQDTNGEDTGKGGDLPDNVVDILKTKGVLVGVPDDSVEGGFKEVNTLESGSLYLKIDDKVVSADNLISEVHNNVKLYNAIEAATYSRAAYYYDDSAQEVFKEIGTNRDNYTGDSEFEEVMDNKIGSGSNIKVTGAKPEEQNQRISIRELEKTGCEKHADYRPSEIRNDSGVFETANVCKKKVEETWGSKTEAAIKDSGAAVPEFVGAVVEENLSNNESTATENSADTLKATDAVSKQWRSSMFFLTFMENIDKMKAGDGNESKINDAMNFLYDKQKSYVIDVETGKKIESEGTALESPSLYAILAGESYDAKNSVNYSSDRVLKTIEKRGMGTDSISDSVVEGTVTTPSSEIKGDVGRYLENDYDTQGNTDQLMVAEEMLNESLVDNSFETVKGINAGEMLVEGAINVGKELANASGGVAGDEEAVISYLKLNSEILALDAASDRMNRSPFDITSKNTFLGSIMYNLAISLHYNESKNSILSNMMSFLKTTASSVNSLLPLAHAEEVDSYLGTHGIDCETLDKIGTVGSPQCVEVSTFDPQTLNDPLNNDEFKDYVKKNTEGSSIKKGSEIAGFIYSTKRKSPVGITDGDVLDKLKEFDECYTGGSFNLTLPGESGSKDCGETVKVEQIASAGASVGAEIGLGLNLSADDGGNFITDIVTFLITTIKTVISSLSKSIAVLLKFKEADSVDRAKASGEYYANTKKNREDTESGEPGPWQQNRWAQRYVSLNRAMESMRRYAVNYDGRVAYDIAGFEWEENPVVAFVRESYNNDTVVAEEEDSKEKEEESGYAVEELKKIFSYLDNNPTIKEAVETELVNTYGISLNQLVLR